MKFDTSIKLLKKVTQVARDVGIHDRSFIGFGTALGAVRPTRRTDIIPPYYCRGLMQHDHDMDNCFLNLTREEKEEYFKACKKVGLFNWGHPHSPAGRQARKKDGELLWFSLTYKKSRMCQWFCFDHQGWLWHTKGKRWLEKFDSRKYKFNKKYDAIMKGTPSKLYEDLTPIQFEGVEVNIPTKIGHLLDDWYPGWAVPKKGGASRKNIVCVVEDWNSKKTWKVICT